MALNVDIPATILAASGSAPPKRYQGRNLMNLVSGKKPKTWRDDTFCEHLMTIADIPKWEGVRGSRYAYARYFEQNPPIEFLHDLKADPDQLKKPSRRQGVQGNAGRDAETFRPVTRLLRRSIQASFKRPEKQTEAEKEIRRRESI